MLVLIRAPKHVEEVSSIELGGASKDLSKFEALTPNDTPHTLESADEYVHLMTHMVEQWVLVGFVW